MIKFCNTSNLHLFPSLKTQKIAIPSFYGGLMPTIFLDQMPEVFLSNKELSLLVSNVLKRGKIRKLASKLYTKNLIEEPEIISNYQ